jgi:adaptin ear-binding coat-associated protein 1/2
MAEIIEDQTQGTHFEQIVLSVQECFVYRIPTMRSASGHRAEDWSLATPQFTGALRVYQSDLKLRIALFTYNDPTVLSMAVENITLFGGEYHT